MKSRYQIIGEINQGGVGVVLKAWDTKLQRHVAIKRFLSREQREALGNVDGDLLQEASTLSSMHHPNIVSVYDVDMEAAGGPEVIMEYLNGQDLEQAVSQAALTLEDFYQVAQQTLDALGNAHRMNLLHRDIKPSNIQVTWLANGKFVSKFVDFGLAKFFEKPSKQTVRHDGTVLGSIYYMAPEQFERQPLDNRSDIYSLGCVFYFALTMHRPYEGETVNDVINGHLRGGATRVRDFRPNVPRDLEKWVEWMMSRSPDRRPADAELALTALRQIIAGQTPDAVPGVKAMSQPVSAAPMRTGDVRIPQASAFTTRTAGADSRPKVSSSAPKTPAAGKPVKKKKTRATGKPLIIGAVAAAVAAGGFFMLSGGGKKQVAAQTEKKPSSATDILDAANREAALHKTKLELAATQARLAVAQSSPQSSGMSSSQPKRDITQPPAPGLVLWFDAATGTRAGANSKAAVTGGPVGQWDDVSLLGGQAIFQYTASTTRDKEQNFPTLLKAPGGNGLISPRPVLFFDGSGDNLCVRDKDKTGDPIGNSLDGGNNSVFLVFRAAGPDAPEGLIIARNDKVKKPIWSLGIKNKGLIASPGFTEPLQVPGSEGEFRIASFIMNSGAHEVYLGLISSDSRKSSLPVKTSVPEETHIDSLRMGTSDGSGTQGRSLFAGDIAEVLIYGRALDSDTRHHAENYLRQKYFGSAGQTAAANGK